MFVDPIAHTGPSLKLLGTLLGQPQAGAAYAAFYTQKLDTIRAAGLSTHPQSVMLQVYPGMMECCWVPGRSGFGQYIPLASGSEIGAAQFAAPFGGQLALEYVLKSAARFYIATGLSATSGNQGLVIGFGVDNATASASLAHILQAPEIAAIPAVAAQRGFGLWNFFNGSPLNILAIEIMAEWFQPGLAQKSGLNATVSFAQIREQFLHKDLTGTLWVAPGT